MGFKQVSCSHVPLINISPADVQTSIKADAFMVKKGNHISSGLNEDVIIKQFGLEFNVEFCSEKHYLQAENVQDRYPLSDPNP